VTYIFDTNVLSTFRKTNPNPEVARWLARIGWDEIATTIVTVMEIQRGIERTRTQHPGTAEAIEAWLAGMLAVGRPRVVGMTVEAARLLGRMYETPGLRDFIVTDRQANAQATGADLSIAAIAITVGATIVTGNTRHFLQINSLFPLPALFDPFTQSWHLQQDSV
jgi:predicted nucleic acid-binding protein